ncbi:unnamed protein product [Heterobilharzia americana]|nr:unnamed protein product [Heterobilharzia americana]CAH8521050.1 unnamed protein product [Heterobilharzia americana]
MLHGQKWRLFPMVKLSNWNNSKRMKHKNTINPSLIINNMSTFYSRASMKFKNFMVGNLKKPPSIQHLIYSIKNVTLQNKHFKYYQYSSKELFKSETFPSNFNEPTTDIKWTTVPPKTNIKKVRRIWNNLQDSLTLPYATISGMINNRYKRLRDSPSLIYSGSGTLKQATRFKTMIQKIRSFPIGIKYIGQSVNNLRRIDSMHDNLMTQTTNDDTDKVDIEENDNNNIEENEISNNWMTSDDA